MFAKTSITHGRKGVGAASWGSIAHEYRCPSGNTGNIGAGDFKLLSCRARVPCGDNGTPPYFGLSRELFGPGEEVPHLGGGAAHRRATSITGISGTAAVGRTSVGSGT